MYHEEYQVEIIAIISASVSSQGGTRESKGFVRLKASNCYGRSPLCAEGNLFCVK